MSENWPRDPQSPYARIARAAYKGKGVRLSPEECQLLYFHDDSFYMVASRDIGEAEAEDLHVKWELEGGRTAEVSDE